MNYEALAKDILKYVGNQKNVEMVTHCATRLRINVKSVDKLDVATLESLKGVIGVVVSGNQLQIVIGQDVPNVYRAFMKLGNFDNQDKEKSDKNIVIRMIDTLSGIFTPILPALCGAGMLKAVLVLLTMFHIVGETSTTYQLIQMFSDALFYFLPMFLAFTAAKKFDCNPFVAMSVGGILLHPTFTAMVATGDPVSFFGINVPLVTYSSSVIPIILTVLCMSYIERLIDKITPSAIKYFIVPLVTLLISAPIALLVFGPLGTILGGWLSTGIMFLNSKAGWLVITLMGAFSPLIIMTGMHYSLFPIVFQSLATVGYDTIMSVGSLPGNLAQGGACLAVACKTKDRDFRSLAVSSGITAVMGITEPALYGVTLRLKKPFIAVMIAGGIGGLYAGLMGLKSFGFVSPGLAAFPVYFDPSGSLGNIINFVITCCISFIASFILTFIIGFDDIHEKKQEVPEIKTDEKVSQKLIKSPVSGSIVPLKDVHDQVFSAGIMGRGIGVYPSQGSICAPADGVITALFDSKHAIGITTHDGIEILIHVGIDTVHLQGKFFTSKVVMNQEVHEGDELLLFDLEQIVKEGFDPVVCVIITNSKDFVDVIETQDTTIKANETLLAVI